MRIRRRSVRPTATALVIAGLLGSCATSPGVAGGGSGATLVGPPGSSSVTSAVLTGSGTVLELDGRGPQLCLGAVAASYPPQCGGPAVKGWDWAKAPRHESAGGVTWGSYTVTGRYNGTSFTLTAPPRLPRAGEGDIQSPRTDFTPGCPTPAGGWVVVDPSRTTQETQSAVFEAASRLPGYAASWISDQPTEQPQSSDGTPAQQPSSVIVNVAVTRDRAGAEAALRAVWGGKLCVTTAPRTEADLTAITDAITTRYGPQVLTTSTDGRTGKVWVTVVHDDGTLQTALDASYGTGVVSVDSALKPA